jgi:hypothetical protein
LDSDNTWKPDYLCAMIGFFQVQPDADAAYGGQVVYRGKESEPFAVRFGCYNPSLLRNRNYIDLNGFIHRHGLLERINAGFNERMKRWVDWELILRISRVGQIYSVPILQSNYYLDKAENTITNTEAIQPAHKAIMSTWGYGQQIDRQASDNQLTGKVAIIISVSQGKGMSRTGVDSLSNYFSDPSVEILVVDGASQTDVPRDSSDQKCVNEKAVATVTGILSFPTVKQAFEATDPDSDILLLDGRASLAPGTLPALQKSANANDSIAISVPQRVVQGDEAAISKHVPYADGKMACDITLSGHLRNIEAIPIFHDGEMVDLKWASLFCMYIKREVWELCGEIGSWQEDQGRFEDNLCDCVHHVLGKRIVYNPDAIVFDYSANEDHAWLGKVAKFHLNREANVHEEENCRSRARARVTSTFTEGRVWWLSEIGRPFLTCLGKMTVVRPDRKLSCTCS